MRVCVHTVGDGGVGFYRTLQPYRWVGENSDIDVFIYDPKIHSPQRLKDEIEAADVLVYQMAFGEFIKNIVKDNAQRAKPKKIVLEYDDQIFSVHPMNPAYKTFGIEEIYITYKDKFTADNAKKLLRANGDDREIIDNPDGSSTFEMWKDGKNGFDLKANRLRALGAQYAIAHADLVTVTNNFLGKQFRKYRPKGPIAVIPNVVDFERWLPMKPNESDEIRIGWQGGCVDDQTEILTKDGFKFFKDLKADDFVATLNKDKFIEYHQPKRIINEKYNGDMYYYDEANVNFALTPEHRVYHKTKNPLSDYRFKTMSELRGKNYRVKKNAKWNGSNIESISIAGKTFEIDDWLKFFGFWIAEGWTTDTQFQGKGKKYNLMQVGIRQVKDNGFLQEIYNIMSKYYPVKLEREKGQLRIFNKDLWLYLKQFGKSNKKYLPDDIKSLSSEKLKILLEWYINGDGHRESGKSYNKPRVRAWTVSKILADDLTEVALKIGWSTSIENRGKRDSQLNGRPIIAKNDCYQISFLRSDVKFARLEPYVFSKNIQVKRYVGRKYCVEVENGTWLLRRNGKIHWTGNSAHYQDLHLIRKPLWKLLDKHKNLKLVLQGVGFDALFKANPDNNMTDYSNRIEWRAWHSDQRTYPLDLREMRCDIAICPVIDDPFNRGKSELKWIEFGAMKIPCVVSPVCYTSVKHGKTGFVANNETEWFEYLDLLITNKQIRDEMGQKVYDRIRGHHDVNQYQGLVNILKDLMANNIKTFTTVTNSRELVAA